MPRQLVDNTASIEARLIAESERLKQEARIVRSGLDREALLQKARQARIAAHINRWLTSPGLSPPK